MRGPWCIARCERTTKLAGSDANTAPPNSARSCNASAAMLPAKTAQEREQTTTGAVVLGSRPI